MTKSIKELDSEYIAHSYSRFPVVLKEGKGSVIRDEDGKEYIDLGSGIAVNIFGIGDEQWVSAVTEQLNKLQHTSNLYYSEPCARLAELLCEKTGMKKVFFCNSGAEANECAIKAARKYAKDTKGVDCKIITLVNSFHGRTITTLAATGQEVFHKDFTPLTEGFIYAGANDLDSVKKLMETNDVAAVMMESVQGEGGVMPLEEKFVKGVAELCREHGALLVMDEVQTGNGRTGKLYGYMNFGVTPDIVTTAKGIGGGLPLGVCMLGEKVQDVFQPGLHGSTFGGNPVCCAGAISIMERIDEELLRQVREKSDYVFKALQGAKGVKSVSGMGLMIGVETERPAKDIVADCMEQGVLVLTAKTKVRLLPALNIPLDELEKAVAVLKAACGK